MHIPIEGHVVMLCDNEAVVRNSTMPESISKERHVPI